MLFTPAERRLLAAIALLLTIGYLVSALRYWGLLPPVPIERGGRVAVEGERADPPPAPREAAAVAQPIDPDCYREGFLDLNRADSVALLGLPGIGPALAGRILAVRRARGAFGSLDELLEVRGIGPKRLARLRDYLCLRPAAAAGPGRPAGGR